MANAKAFNHAEIHGVLMEKMARGGVEVILGATRDPKFGPICMFGLGGTFVEAIKDVTFRLAPMWEVSAEIMIQNIKAYKVLLGIRGIPAGGHRRDQGLHPAALPDGQRSPRDRRTRHQPADRLPRGRGLRGRRQPDPARPGPGLARRAPGCFEELSDFCDRLPGLRDEPGIGMPHVDHVLPDVDDRYAHLSGTLCKATGVIQKDFLRAYLDQDGWKARESPYRGDAVGVFGSAD